MTNPGQPVSAKYQLLFGPWDHGNQGASVDMNKLQLQWFDHWLKGMPTGITTCEMAMNDASCARLPSPGNMAARSTFNAFAAIGGRNQTKTPRMNSAAPR